MLKVSKYEQRAAQKRQAERAGVPYYEAPKPHKAVLSPQEAASKRENANDRVYPKEVLEEMVDNSSLPLDHKRVIFMSRNDASGYPYRPGDAIISITDTHAEPPQFFRKPDNVEVLHRGFHDHVTVRSEAQGERWCRIEDGEAIVEFVHKHKDAPTIVVHCNMGQSRSKAAALAIAEFTKRAVKCYNREGRLVAYRDDGDDGNRRVWSCIMHAEMDREEVESEPVAVKPVEAPAPVTVTPPVQQHYCPRYQTSVPSQCPDCWGHDCNVPVRAE